MFWDRVAGVYDLFANYYNAGVHRALCQDVASLVSPAVWAKIEPLIEGLPLVAHNSSFDEGCLRSVFKVYRMDYPDYEFFDTFRASRRHFGRDLPNHQLQTVAAACGYDLTRHHHALADAEACAAIALKIL